MSAVVKISMFYTLAILRAIHFAVVKLGVMICEIINVINVITLDMLNTPCLMGIYESESGIVYLVKVNVCSVY